MSRGFRAAPPLQSLSVLLMLIGLVALVPTLHAQLPSASQSSPGLPHPGLPHGNDEDSPFRDNPELRNRLEKGRAADRQRRIVDDANRLVALTAQYRQQVDAHGKPTDDDQKLLAQIEKLARDVKDRMRGM